MLQGPEPQGLIVEMQPTSDFFQAAASESDVMLGLKLWHPSGGRDRVQNSDSTYRCNRTNAIHEKWGAKVGSKVFRVHSYSPYESSQRAGRHEIGGLADGSPKKFSPRKNRSGSTKRQVGLIQVRNSETR